MAEDKRIRVSADSTPLQELRQNAQALWNDFSKMENSFKDLAEKTVGVIQEQINLLKERNSLLSENLSFPANESRRTPALIDPYTERPLISQDGGSGNLERPLISPMAEKQLLVYDKILSEIVRIADILEKNQRDNTNGVLPTTEENVPSPVPPPPSSPELPVSEPVGGNKPSSGFRIPTNMGGLMSMLPFGALIMSIGTILGQQAKFSAQQYGAENEFQRRNNLGNHWLLNMLTFGISGAEAEKKEVGRMAATQNDKALEEYAALHNISYREAIGRQFIDSFQDTAKIAADDGNTWYDYVRERKALNPSYEPTTPFYPATTSEKGEYQDWMRGRTSEASSNGITEEELPNWASRTLGLNMTEYLTKVTSLQRAGVYERNTSLYDINQLLMAGKIRGLSEEDAASVLATTRFDRSGRTGANVVQAFDTNLQGLGKSDQYIASTLGEYLQSFNRISESILAKVGSINTAGIVRSMTSIQNATGMEGRQLERVQNSLMGNNISQDDVTQALLLRTARDISGGEGNLSDLQAMIEEMPNNPELQMKFFERIQKMTGGGEIGRQVLKQIFPNLSMRDIIDLEKSTGMDAKKIFKSGRSTGMAYSEEDARSKVGEIAASTAATQNRKIRDGIDEILSGKTSISGIISELKKEPIPVVLVSPPSGSAGTNLGSSGAYPTIQLSDEAIKKVYEAVAKGAKEGTEKTLNNMVITQE